MTESVEFNPMDPEFIQNPYPVYRALRETTPVRFEPTLGGWMFTRYDDVSMILRDSRTIRPPAGDILLSRVPPEVRAELHTFEEKLSTSLPFSNPPDHTRLRGLVSKGFTPRAIEAMRPRIQEITDERLDALATSERAELMADFCYRIPTSVIMEFLGIPREDHMSLMDLLTDIMPIIGQAVPSADPAAVARTAADATERVSEYLVDLVEHRRKAPTGDLLSNLVSATDDTGRLTHDELVLTVLILLGAGLETTSHYFGNGILALLRHPDAAKLLREDPSVEITAADELIRYDGPVAITTPQLASADMEVGGQHIEAGQLLFAVLGAGNHDPARFPDPETLDLRRPAGAVLTFGGGIHFCLGASLARMEGQIAFGSLLRRFPNLRLDDAATPPVYRPDPVLRGLESLPVVLDH